MIHCIKMQIRLLFSIVKLFSPLSFFHFFNFSIGNLKALFDSSSRKEFNQQIFIIFSASLDNYFYVLWFNFTLIMHPTRTDNKSALIAELIFFLFFYSSCVRPPSDFYPLLKIRSASLFAVRFFSLKNSIYNFYFVTTWQIKRNIKTEKPLDSNRISKTRADRYIVPSHSRTPLYVCEIVQRKKRTTRVDWINSVLGGVFFFMQHIILHSFHSLLVFLFSSLFQLQVARLLRLRILNKFSTWFRIDNRSLIGCHCNIVDCGEVKSWVRMRRLQFGNRRITGRRQARSQWMFLFFYSFLLDPQQVLLQVIWAFYCFSLLCCAEVLSLFFGNC